MLIEVATKEEAIEWARRCPTLTGCGDVEIEVRQVVEADNFPVELTPELARLPWTTVATEAAARLRPAKAAD